MPALKTSFLLIGPWDSALSEIGAIIAPTLSDALSLKDPVFEVVGLTATALLEKKFAAFREDLRRRNPCVQWVAVVPEGMAASTLAELHHENSLSKLLKTSKANEAEPALYEALEAANRLRQDLAIERMLQEQEVRLEGLRAELESRVEKRTRMLAESRHNLHIRNSRLEGLRKALLAVQEASSFADMEKSLNDSLASTVETSWIRIVPVPRDDEFEKQIISMDGFAWQGVPLWRHHEKIGTAFYMRPKDRPFKREDNDFLGKISEAVALALDHLTKLREAENLKEQWEATFVAINEPVAIIDRQYQIVQANSQNVAGTSCHQRFFGRPDPCPGCRRGESFRLEEGGRLYDVHSQLLALDPQREAFYVNLYTDVTERTRMERHIIESAKLAELGTVGSSIAHELNNPLGGVLNFAQLLRMDLPKDHPFHEDLKEIEDGAQRCKEIVENLLGFTRAPRADEIKSLDLRDVIKRALKVIELRTKSAGIELIFKSPEAKGSEGTFLIKGHLNLLSQAIKNVLERSIDSILSLRSRQPAHRGVLELDLGKDFEEDGREIFVLRILDNGREEDAIRSRHGLALQIATQILHDNEATLELNASSSPDSWAKISFSRPVLRS